jgi:hypothetical protein
MTDCYSHLSVTAQCTINHHSRGNKEEIYFNYLTQIFRTPVVDAKQRTQYPIVTGTSVLGLTHTSGVIIAADTLGSYGSLAMFKSFSRMKKVCLFVVICCHLLSSVVICCHLLSSVVICCHLLSSVVFHINVNR